MMDFHMTMFKLLDQTFSGLLSCVLFHKLCRFRFYLDDFFLHVFMKTNNKYFLVSNTFIGK